MALHQPSVMSSCAQVQKVSDMSRSQGHFFEEAANPGGSLVFPRSWSCDANRSRSLAGGGRTDFLSTIYSPFPAWNQKPLAV